MAMTEKDVLGLIRAALDANPCAGLDDVTMESDGDVEQLILTVESDGELQVFVLDSDSLRETDPPL